MEKKSKLYIGSLTNPTYMFKGDSIFSANVEQKVSLVGQNLSYDTLTINVADDYANVVDVTRFLSSDGQEIVTGAGEVYCVDVGGFKESGLLDLPDQTPVWYYNGNDLIGKFYLDDVTREAKNQYRLECVSAIGVLDKMQHGGGLFLQSTFGEVLRHILAADLHGDGDPVIPYEIDDDVAALRVSGWLPKDTKRNNLYQLVFAYGVNIIKNPDGNPRFTFVYSGAQTPTQITSEVIYDEGAVTYTKPYSRISVTEHTYTAVRTVEAVVLHDNTADEALNNAEIWFTQAPVIVDTLSTEGDLTIVSATENSVVLTGTGKLTGIPYTHTERVVNRDNTSATEEKVISISKCTMANAVNSDNLLNRLYAFYCPAGKIKEIKGSFVQNSERCGKAYTIKNRFGEDENVFLSQMDLTTSAITKANATFFADYVPMGQAGLYSHVDILVPTWDETYQKWVYAGTWQVPEGVTEFKVVMIGGGTGGESGYAGDNGGDAYAHTYVESNADISAIWFGAEGGDGGNGGNGGNAGRVKAFTIQNATAGDTYNYTLGQGGEGGASTGFKPDTLSELRSALENENPNITYTDEEINALIAQEATDWNGAPNAGSAGGATTFKRSATTWSTADSDGYTPTAGVYEPINGEYYGLHGNTGIKGGKGGARKVTHGTYVNWVADGENVTDLDGKEYRGGQTGRPLTSVNGLPEARLTVYGGNGAGAAVGIDRDTHTHINGEANQSTSWRVTENS